MSKSVAEMQFGPRGRFVMLYYLLALLICATTVVGLWLLNTVERNYAAALAEAEEWKGYLDEVATLESALDVLSTSTLEQAAGLNTDQLEGAADRFRAVWSRLFEQIDDERNDVHQDVVDAVPTLLQLLHEARDAVDRIEREGLKHAVPSRGDAAAGQLVHEHNTDAHGALLVLRNVSAEMRAVQSRLSRAHARELESLRALENMLGLTLIGIVAFLLVFGRVLHLRFARNAVALEHARVAAATEATRFKDFAEVASDWMWETDAEHRVCYLSDNVSAHIQAAAWLGTPLQDHIAESPRHGRSAALMARLLDKRREFQNLLVELRASDGGAYVMCNGVPKFDAHGAFLGYRGASRNVTQTITAQEALRKSEDLHRSVASSVDGIIARIRLSDAWTVEYVSPKNEEMFGIAPAQVIGLDIRDIWRFGIHADDQRRHRSAVEDAIAARGTFEIECRVKSPSGRYLWVLERGRVVRGGPGEADVLDTLMVDVTARKEAEGKAAEAEGRVRALMETIDEVFYTCLADDNWTAVYLSPGFERLSGYAVDDVIGSRIISLGDLVHPDDRERVKAIGSAANGATFEMTYRLVTKSGDVRWIFERGRRSGETASEQKVISGFMTDITEMKRLEDTVNERNRRLEMLARNLNGSIYRGRISPSEVVSCFGRRPPTLEMMHKDDLYVYAHEVADACRAMRPYEVEYRINDVDGVERWMLERGVPAEPGDDGIAQFVDGLVIDVTQQRRLRDELEAREKLVSALANNLEGAMFRARRGDKPAIEYISPGIKKITGLGPEDLIGRPPESLNLRHPDDYAEYRATIARAIQERRPYESEHRLILPDGTVRWILERGSVSEYAHDGSPLLIDGFLFDVTERRQLTEELKVREERLSGLASNIEGVLFRTRLGRSPIIEYYSPGIKKHIGMDAADLIGKPPIGIKLTHPDDRERYDRVLTAALKNNTPYEIEFRIVLADGQIKWVLERGRTTAFDAKGRPAVMEGMSIDVTAQKEAEKELAAARDAAEAASHAKSEFLAMMSHEIRTPMNGVIGMTGVLLDSELTTDQRRSATIIRDSAESLLRIINDVLDFSKLDAGAVKIETTTFDLHSFCNYAAEIMEPRARAKRVALSVEIDHNVPRFVRADAGRIRQIVLNLLGNAVKFTETGSVKLVVSAPRGRLPLVRMRVVDTGIGIPADRLSQLFKSFEQADSSVWRRFGGTGLGLAISKKLVELMGGKIGVESEAGRGSTFWFELPVGLASEDEVVQASSTTSSAAFEAALKVLKSCKHRPRVLVVEDNATNQIVARATLAAFDIMADVAGNGVEALAAVRRHFYDVVLMDLHMPEMDGIEATRAIRAMQGSRALVPIVALTANAFADDVQRCRDAGMNGHLGKPFRKEDLAVALVEALEGRTDFRQRHSSAVDETAPILDGQVIEAFRLDAGEEMLQLLLNGYLSDSAAKLDRLAEIARSRVRTPEALRIAHSLKSASALAGAMALAQASARLELRLLQETSVEERDAHEMQCLFLDYRSALAKGKFVSG